MRTTTTAPESTRRMILIGGVHGRTGTSLVKRLVCQHPQVSAVAAGETRMFEAISELWPLLSTDVGYTPGGGTNGLKAFAEHVRDTLGDTPEIRKSLGRLDKTLGVRYMRLIGRPRLPLPVPQSDEVLAKAFGVFISEAFRAAALDPSRPVLCEKTPSNALYFPRIRRLLPTARIVVMVRNPVAVALSHTKRDWGPTDPIQAARYTAAYFRRWRDMEVQDERCLLVRHEDLVDEPERVFSGVLDHLGLSRTSSVIKYAASQMRPTVDRRSELSASANDEMRALLSDALHHFGYDREVVRTNE